MEACESIEDACGQNGTMEFGSFNFVTLEAQAHGFATQQIDVLCLTFEFSTIPNPSSVKKIHRFPRLPYRFTLCPRTCRIDGN